MSEGMSENDMSNYRVFPPQLEQLCCVSLSCLINGERNNEAPGFSSNEQKRNCDMEEPSQETFGVKTKVRELA